MAEPLFLQSYVVPVVSSRETERGPTIERLFGTAFLIGQGGTFMTAAHVLRDAYAAIKGTEMTVALVGKEAEGTGEGSVSAVISAHDFAPAGADVAVGRSNYRSGTPLRLSRRSPTIWADVATYGYPGDAVSGPVGGLNLNLRGHKGYIQRELRRGDLLGRPSAEGFELSFLLDAGLSGSPLFVHAGDHDYVIGVCTGTIGSQTVQETFREVRAGGIIREETILAVNQFGTAEAVAPLLDWKPDGFRGNTLAEIGGA